MNRVRFTVPQRMLHWVMAVCILAMLFIGVGMVSTVMPKYLTLVSIHKPLGAAILVLALIRRDGVFEAMASVSADDGVAPAE